jgi:hypothetical protein|tara:strand:- start:7524 stop:7637 length:114 start_codon:yes stop_codon:yes gene_type:complete
VVVFVSEGASRGETSRRRRDDDDDDDGEGGDDAFDGG